MSQRALSALSLLPSSNSLAGYAQSLGLPHGAAPTTLARALAVSLAALRPHGAVLVAREHPPALMLLGVLEEPTEILRQARSLDETCRHLRYLDFAEVVRLCERLADDLSGRLGPDELRNARFTAIPRGGFIVLGLLASILGLTEERLQPSEDSGRLLVVVDDCAISGARFQQFLTRHDSSRLLFSTLVSPPALRVAIELREPRVLGCLSAEDLREIPSTPSPELLERRRLRIERGDCYWLGATESLCFPWNEPDRTLWNPRTERSERAWRIVPPELCLKNRPAPGISPLPIQVQPAPGAGPLGPAESVLQAEIDGDVALCDERSGRVFRLEGAGADLWRGLAHTGDLERTLAGLRSTYDVPSEILEADARRLVEDLLARGLLVNRSTA